MPHPCGLPVGRMALRCNPGAAPKQTIPPPCRLWHRENCAVTGRLPAADGRRPRGPSKLKNRLRRCLCLGGWNGGFSVPASANVPCTPNRAPASLAFGGSGHAHAINSRHAWAAGRPNLNNRRIGLRDWSDRHGLGGAGSGKSKNDGHERFHHQSPFATAWSIGLRGAT